MDLKVKQIVTPALPTHENSQFGLVTHEKVLIWLLAL